MEKYFLYYDRAGVDECKSQIPRDDEFWKQYVQIPKQNLIEDFMESVLKEKFTPSYNEIDIPNALRVLEYQKQNGLCFSVKELNEKKREKNKRYYVCDSIHEVRIKKHDDKFIVLDGYCNYTRIVWGMSAHKCFTNDGIHDVFNAYWKRRSEVVDIWGYVIDIPNGIQIKPLLGGWNWIENQK